jgi:antitoxin (DNA-binding transcriptional repressor) of toxin-antitoxin stability system
MLDDGGAMKVSVQAAQTNLSDLIDAALAGEDVIIAKDDKAVVRMVAIARRGFQFGVLEGELGNGPDFFEPMSEDELALWEGAA